MPHASESSRPAAAAPLLAVCAVAQALVLVVFLSWRFGGMETQARLVAAWLCLPAPLITWWAWRQADGELRHHFRRIGIPLAGIAVLVGISALNPHMRMILNEGDPALIATDEHLPFLPSTAWPAHTLQDFVLNAGLVLVALNVLLARPTRNLQLATLAVIAANTGVLACVGTVYKLLGATAILDHYASPNPNFFATFVYYNHWGAFALLGTTAAAGLALHYWHRSRNDQWRRTPAPLFALVAFLIVVTLPLSGARASLAAGALLVMTLAWRSAPRHRSGKTRRRFALGAMIAATAIVVASSWWVASDRLRFVVEKTSIQLQDLNTGGIGDARLPVYRETWDLFMERPIFGWGWQSFRYVFRSRQSFDFKLQNEQRVPSVFLDAHNDWLQRLAELGLAGAVLSAAALVGIARVTIRHYWLMTPSLEIVAGLTCLGLLAFVDFPFACPAVVITAWTLLAIAAGIAHDRDRLGRG